MAGAVQRARSGQHRAAEMGADGIDRRNRVRPGSRSEAGDEQRAGKSGRAAGDDAAHARQGGKVRDREADLPVAYAQVFQRSRAGKELEDEVALPVRRNAFWVRSAGRQRGEGDCGASIPGLGHKREGTQEQRYEKSLQGMRAFHDRISSITCR